MTGVGPALTSITYRSMKGPVPGDYVLPQGSRIRTAYLVVECRPVKPRKPRSHRIWRLIVERMLPTDVPVEATIHPLVWDGRQARRCQGGSLRDEGRCHDR